MLLTNLFGFFVEAPWLGWARNGLILNGSSALKGWLYVWELPEYNLAISSG